MFIVGIRNDIGFKFEFPKPLEGDYQTKVLRDVIGDLPEPGIRLNDKQIAYLDRNPASVAKNRPVTMEEPSRTIPVVMGKGVPYGLFYANHDEKSYWTPKSEYTYDQANRVQSWDKPSNTIPAHHNSGQPIHPQYKNHEGKPLGDYKGFTSRTKRRRMNEASYTVDTRWDINYVHPKQPRRFTVRECLRIQSAPDWYVLPEELSLSAQYRIVGNGIASRVAWYIGRALAGQLRQHTQVTKEVSGWAKDRNSHTAS